MTLFLGDGGERTLSPFDRGGGCGLLLLERVQLVDGLSLNGRCTVIVADPVRLLVRLDLRQAVPCRPGPFPNPGRGRPEAELSVHVSGPCHLSLLQSARKKLLLSKPKKDKAFQHNIYVMVPISSTEV